MLAGRRVDEHLSNVSQAVASRIRPEHVDVEHLAVGEDVANLDAIDQRRRGADDVAWFEAVALCCGEVRFHLQLGLLDDQLHVQVGHAVDAGQRGLDLSSLVAQHVQIRTKHAHHD